MNTEELAQIKEVLHETIHETTKVATAEVKSAIEAHAKGDDHRFVCMMRDREKRRQEMWDKVKASVIRTLLLGGLGAVGTAVYSFFIKNPQ